MYNCPSCEKKFKLSEESNTYIHLVVPNQHILECPHCNNQDLVIGGDEDEYRDEHVFMMYSFHKKENTPTLTIIKGAIV